jgi:hypothetical protein
MRVLCPVYIQLVKDSLMARSASLVENVDILGIDKVLYVHPGGAGRIGLERYVVPRQELSVQLQAGEILMRQQ